MILVVCALSAELRFFTPPANVKIFACGVGPVEAAIASLGNSGRRRMRP